MFPAGDNDDAHYSVVAYETLKPALMSPDKGSAAGAYGDPEAVLPPVCGIPAKTATVGSATATAPNIRVEGGRIEFVRPPADCGDEKQDYLKVSATESADVLGSANAYDGLRAANVPRR